MPVVASGQLTIVDVQDGLHARLTSEQHTVPAGPFGESPDLTGCATTLRVMLGTVDDSANWQFSVSETAGLAGVLPGE